MKYSCQGWINIEYEFTGFTLYFLLNLFKTNSNYLVMKAADNVFISVEIGDDRHTLLKDSPWWTSLLMLTLL